MFFLDNEDCSAFGRVALESPQFELLLRNFAAPTGGSSNLARSDRT
jgi:hypothetical protein